MMLTDPVIRACTLEEAAFLLDFWREAGAEPTATDDPQGVNTLLREREDAVLLAVVEGQIIGTVIAVFDGWRGNIYRLAVIPARRRAGIGRKLVAEAERRLAIRGAKRLSAVASLHSNQAVPFWESMADQGWQPCHPGIRYAKTLVR
jgi:ribosomal protein S18 acetylase RimI-like enzyme